MKDALAFIAATRRDESLREELSAAAHAGGLEAVVAIARDSGYAFSVDDLRSAFAVDWGLRWARYQSR